MIHEKGIKPDYEVKAADFPEDETEELKKMSREKLLNEFVSIKTVYNENTKSEFKKFLQSKNIKISDSTSDFILKREVEKYHKSKIYDLEFDNQINAAIDKLRK
jgi:C-terminal processing protease CtpA/Prc